MGRNLGPLNIKDSYEGLVQISGSQLTDGSGSLIPSLDVTASFATSASHAIFADTAGFATDVNALYTASVVDATISFLKGGGGTFPITVNNVANAVSASYATTASFALTASALVGGVSLQSVLDTGNTATQDITLTGDISATNITASNATFTSASIGFLQTITGSAVIIGDEFVVLNANTPTLRYSGLQVYDSGSAATASFEWDGQQDIWIQVDETGLSGVMLTGDKGTKGAELFPTLNTLQKGNGDSTLSNSSITDDGTLVTINANVSASGYVSASAFIGDGSQITGLPSTDPFPYTGSAEISGSLVISGSVTDAIFKVEGGVITGDRNSITQETNRRNIFGGRENTISSTTTTDQVMIGGAQNTVSGNSSYGAVVGATGATLSSAWGVIIGGFNPSLTSTGAQNGIFAGANNSISGGTTSVILGGQQNTIASGAQRGAIVGGRLNNASHNYSVIVGGLSLSTTKDNEVVVPDLSIYGDTFISASVLGTGSLVDNLGQEALPLNDAVKHIVHCTQAEYDALTPDVNTLYAIDGADAEGNLVISGSLIGEVNTISDAAGTTTLDCSTGNYFTLAMPAGGTTALTPTNLQIGQTINIKITQNATASTLTYAASIDFPGGTAFTISTGSGEVDILTLVSFDGTTLQATGLANFS